jgi:TorA maturation chaperone TorD
MSSISATTDPSAARPAADCATETAKANLYLVLSRAFSSPVVMEPNDPARLRQVTPELPRTLQEAARSLADAWEHGLIHRQELSLAYARLFLGPFEILASPYASFYLQPDQQLMGPVSQSVAEAYAEAGLEPGPGPREAPDHVALEWEFMYFLTHQHLVTGEDRWIERRRAFVLTHLTRWMPSLADAIKGAGEHAFYDTLAALLTNLLKEPALG